MKVKDLPLLGNVVLYKKSQLLPFPDEDDYIYEDVYCGCSCCIPERYHSAEVFLMCANKNSIEIQIIEAGERDKECEKQ